MESALGNFDNAGVRVVAVGTDRAELISQIEVLTAENARLELLLAHYEKTVIEECFTMPPMWSQVDREMKPELTRLIWLLCAMIDNGCALFTLKERIMGDG